jgi:hypothetical protein
VVMMLASMSIIRAKGAAKGRGNAID